MKRTWNPFAYSMYCYILSIFSSSLVCKLISGKFFFEWTIGIYLPTFFYILFALSSVYDFEKSKDAYYESKLADSRKKITLSGSNETVGKPTSAPFLPLSSSALSKHMHVQLKDDPCHCTPFESLLAEKNCVILSAQSALNELKRRNKELEIDNSDLKSALVSAEQQMESLTDSLHGSESTYYEKLEKLVNENTNLKSKLYSCETEIDYLRKRNSRPYASWNMEIVQLRAALDNMENERDALRNKCNEYQRLIKDLKK